MVLYSVYLPVVTAAEVLGLSVGGEGEESHGLVRGHVPGLEQEAPEGILLTPAHQLHTYTHTRTHTRARHLTIKTHGIPQPQGFKYIIFCKAFSLIFFCFTICSTPFFGSIHSTWANYEQDNMVLLNFWFEGIQLQRLTFTCQRSDTE